ncbi:glycerophosphodiester phosphodiesterase family protein [Corynebacterium lubricantis]|uniref:glycerophosphodiester phosphodiesterase family protein n=1 Tax=Corynebacterium lubricantis TaxID=541095 RepID=UPI000381528B|nr:glycerophosphodiester phosphodiesterase family protein [Corynebacterium lubricantis]
MKIVAHRGYAGKYPELTRRAFVEALELPIAGIECDVRLTRDGKLVVFHDKTVDRTSNGSGLVATMDFADLQQLNVGTEDEPQQVMQFSELLELMQDYPDKELFVETKHPSRFGPEVEEQTAVHLRYAAMHEDPRVSLISFSHLAIRRFGRLLPELRTYFLVNPKHRRWNPQHRFASKPFGVGPSLMEAKIDQDLIGFKGLPTYLWTVDEADDMVWCRDNGVDVMATNLPERALETLR